MMYKKNILLFSLVLNLILSQDIYPGYILYTPTRPGNSEFPTSSYLQDIDGSIVKSWNHDFGPASMPYFHYNYEIDSLKPLLYYPCLSDNPTMVTGGTGGRIEIYLWDGSLIWEFEMANEQYQHHHDIEVLPNGNILMIAYERKYALEWQSAGRVSVNNPLNEMWSTTIFEIAPNFENGTADIIWEWHLWDHLVQDIGPEYTSVYGNIFDHPELMDINCNTVGSQGTPGFDANGDWMHINAIDYNDELKQIVFSSRNMDEIYIIEHSTSSEIASSHTGGLYGKGGDFLYRWGNSLNYSPIESLEKMLDTPHSVNWIPKGYPGEGNLIIFNNKHLLVAGLNRSGVVEITPPLNNQGLYDLSSGVFGPNTYLWEYSGGDFSFYSPFQSGAFRQPNGNTLITAAMSGDVFEVTSEGEIVWIIDHGDTLISIARAEKYGYNYFENVYLQGDLNNDGLINIQDIIGTVNIALGVDEYNSSVDMNSDGTINVQDIILLLNIILNS